MSNGTACAVAYPNIALIKYWGKRDEALVLPVTDSLSMTLDIYPTTTRVRLVDDACADVVFLNGHRAEPQTHLRVERFLDVVRQWSGRNEHAVVHTTNTVPTGAGLASSASGFAALATAAAAAFELRLDARSRSRLARRGSGSACRSIFGGFVQWHAGRGEGQAGDHSSYAEPVADCPLDPALVVAVVDSGAKAVPSRQAMRQTMATSPLYLPWANANAWHLDQMRAAMTRDDLAAVGEIAEHNALGMHATMLAARPAIRYLAPRSVAVLDRILSLRNAGIPAYATVDAGPNVKVLCSRANARMVAQAIEEVGDYVTTRIAHRGRGAALVSEESS